MSKGAELLPLLRFASLRYAKLRLATRATANAAALSRGTDGQKFGATTGDKMYDRSKAHYVVATSIIRKDNKFLIAKRAAHEKVHPNLWTVPGGKLEMSDYIYRHKDTPIHWYNILENVVKREVMEETGLEIKNLNYHTSMVYLRPDGIQTIIISLFADHHQGSVNLSKDLTEYKWVTLEHAKDYELIDGIYEELVMLDKRIKGEQAHFWTKT